MIKQNISVNQPIIDELINCYGNRIKKSHGKMFFISGEKGTGITDTLKELFKIMKKSENAWFLVGNIDSNNFKPWDEDSKTLQKMTVVNSAISLINAPIISSLLSLSLESYKYYKDSKKVASLFKDDLDIFRFIFKFANEERPIVVIIDDLDKAAENLWPHYIRALAYEIYNLPVMFVFGLETLKGDKNDCQDEELLEVINYLKTNNLACEKRIKQFKKDELELLMGKASKDVIDELFYLSNGRPKDIETYFEILKQNSSIVLNKNEIWILNKENASQLGMHAIIEDKLSKIFKNKEQRKVSFTYDILKYAILEGKIFTAQAVANVLGIESDEVIDFIDEYLLVNEKNTDGIFIEYDCIFNERDDNYIWRYKFTSDLVYKSHTNFSESIEGIEELSIKYANSLIQVYSFNISLIAKVLANLYKRANQEDNKLYYNHISRLVQNMESFKTYLNLIVKLINEGAPINDEAIIIYIYKTQDVINFNLNENKCIFENFKILYQYYYLHKNEFCLGLLFYIIGSDQEINCRISNSQEFLEKSLECFNKCDETYYKGQVLILLGHTYRVLTRLDEAEEKIKQGIKILESPKYINMNNIKMNLLNAYSEISCIYIMKNKVDDEWKHIRNTLSECVKYNQIEKLCLILMEIIIYNGFNDFKKSLKPFLNKLILILKGKCEFYYYGILLQCYGVIELYDGTSEAAIKLLKESIEVFSIDNYYDNGIISNFYIAEAYIKNKELQKALNYLNNFLKSIANSNSRVDDLSRKARCYLEIIKNNRGNNIEIYNDKKCLFNDIAKINDIYRIIDAIPLL